MNWKYTLVAGAGTGATLATFVSLIMVIIGLEPPSFASALAIFLLMILASALIVEKTLQRIGYGEPSLKQLIPVSFCTFLLPILGASFGAPNSDLDTIVIIILLGAAGGVFWSIPFALWSFISDKKLTKEEE